MKMSTNLRELINSNDLSFIMEAHDGMSAKVVEKTGFKAIWASGLSLSTSLGYRDNNELSFSQVADQCYHIARCVNIPVLVDCDTMYGDFNTARTALQLFERSGVGGVVIEDKVFPKKNSFLNNGLDALADPEEFALKIRSLQDSKTDKDFVIIARVESFLVGAGLEDALKRARLYVDEGHADAILIHSKKPDGSEIMQFMETFDRDVPVVIVPTKYYTVPTAVWERLGVSSIIWANHNMRSALTAMRETCQKIYYDQSLMGVEDKIVSVSEVFRFQGNDELEKLEEIYLPKKSYQTAIILAASETNGMPKTMIPINGKSLLDHQIRSYSEIGVKSATISVSPNDAFTVPETDPGFEVEVVVNPDYSQTFELDSLKKLSSFIKKGTFISYGDLIFRKHILREMMESDGDIVIVSDAEPGRFFSCNYNEYVSSQKSYDKNELYRDNLVNIVLSKTYNSHDQLPSDINGVFIGLMLVKTDEAAEKMKAVLQMVNDTRAKRMEFLINKLIDFGVKITNVYTTSSSWSDINEIKDLLKVGEF